MGKLKTSHSLRLCLFLLWATCTAWAVDPNQRISQYGHTAWRIQDGLFGGAPNAIAQTTDGYLWIGTQGGLTRFDGVRFVPWVPLKGKLVSSGIFSLLAGTDGSLWIGTSTNLAHLQNGNLTNYLGADGRVNSIVQGHDGRIWITRSRVHDDKGPLCEVVNGREGHHGLQGMRERAARIQGRLTILSSADSGTDISVIVPGSASFLHPDTGIFSWHRNAYRLVIRNREPL